MNVALRPDALNCISLCTGGGGLDLGVELAIPSARVVCMVEREAFAVAHLVEAIEQGLLAPAPIHSDVRTFPGRRFRGVVDGVFGGIPCQPHSEAGKRLGAADERDLWSATRRIIVQSGAWWVLIENVAGMVTSGGAERVWRDLHRLGFSVTGGLFAASEVGASHERQRLFILGVADSYREHDHGRGFLGTGWGRQPSDCGGGLGHAEGQHDQGARQPDTLRRALRRGKYRGSGAALVDTVGRRRDGRAQSAIGGSERRTVDERPSRRPGLFPPGPGDLNAWRGVLERAPDLEPSVRRMADGLAERVEQLRVLGNGVVPVQAGYALRTLAIDLARRSAGAALLVRMMEAA